MSDLWTAFVKHFSANGKLDWVKRPPTIAQRRLRGEACAGCGTVMHVFKEMGPDWVLCFECKSKAWKMRNRR